MGVVSSVIFQQGAHPTYGIILAFVTLGCQVSINLQNDVGYNIIAKRY